jgi:hypothetical protein
MDQLSQLLQLPTEASNLVIPTLLMNLVFGVIFGMVMRVQYIRFARSLANRELFANNFIPLILAIILIISIVKASLALSLGLVGALSIVRFRTPIKDPEELIYLFLAIGIGLGLGANQPLATGAAFAFIFTVLTIRTWRGGGGGAEIQSMYVEVEIEQEEQPDSALTAMVDAMRPTLQGLNLRRFDTRSGALLASFSVSYAAGGSVGATAAALRMHWPNARITFLDQDHVPGV